jgi:hypothetical protein
VTAFLAINVLADVLVLWLMTARPTRAHVA